MRRRIVNCRRKEDIDEFRAQLKQLGPAAEEAFNEHIDTALIIIGSIIVGILGAIFIKDLIIWITLEVI